MKVPHPIPYQGSKRQLAAVILSYAPRHASRLVEPFAGSAALTLAAAKGGRAAAFWINDAHSPLAALWREIVGNPEELLHGYSRLWNEQIGRERDYYDEVRERFNNGQGTADFLYLLARCVKAAIRYNGAGEFNNSPDNRRRGATPAAMAERVQGASKLLRKRTTVTSLDYREVLADCGPDDLIYMDPPYRGVCGRRDARYCPTVDHEQFCDSLAELNRQGCRWIVSYDGRSGDKVYGRPLPASLGCLHVELDAGRSTQATLLGRECRTVESLYVSPALAVGDAKKSLAATPQRRLFVSDGAECM